MRLSLCVVPLPHSVRTSKTSTRIDGRGVNWALLAAGVGLASYQTWAIWLRWREARGLPPADRKIMLWTLILTRGLGWLLGVGLIIGALYRASQ